MNTDIIEKYWTQRGSLTNADSHVIEEKNDQFIVMFQEIYGIEEDMSAKHLAELKKICNESIDHFP